MPSSESGSIRQGKFLPFPSPVRVETPPEFGEPIRTGGYINDRPCWVLLKKVTVLIKLGKNVRFSAFT